MDHGEKLHSYQQVIGVGNVLKQNVRERYQNWRDEHPLGIMGIIKNVFNRDANNLNEEELSEEFLHVLRKKTRWELVRISLAVTGIEFAYAAETAFVSPTLLKIGMDHRHMTMVWALSPLIGFFLTPVLGSLSDQCKLNFGRRRPFILLMSLGVLIGLILIPNGESIGYALGDPRPPDVNVTLQTKEVENRHPWGVFLTILGTVLLDFNADGCQSPVRAYLLDITVPEDHAKGLSTFTIMAGIGGTLGYALGAIDWDKTAIGRMFGGHVRAVFTLITGIFVACIMYTVTSFREVPLRLANRTNFMKLESMRRLENDETSPSLADEKITLNLDNRFCVHVMPPSGASNAETIETVKNIATVLCKSGTKQTMNQEETDENITNGCETDMNQGSDIETVQVEQEQAEPSVKMYLKTIIFLPRSLKILCLTNLFCWMAHVCYSLYFTDFVGEAVFKGNPTALLNSESRQLYEEGVRFGCWGMSLYSLSCSCYSSIIERLICRFKARRVYVGGLCVYCLGMFFMALCRNKIAVIIFSCTAGVMYSTLFTMPYLLISEYHEKKTVKLQFSAMDVSMFYRDMNLDTAFEINDTPYTKEINSQIRGIGTDLATVSNMVFLAQFILSLCMGKIIDCVDSTTAVVTLASVFGLCGAISATQVMYLD